MTAASWPAGGPAGPGRPAGLGRRTGQLLLGLGLYALSMAMLLRADLGAMPWDVLTQGLVRHLPLSFGSTTALVGVLVLACWVPLRQRPAAGTVANVVVISAAVDPALALLAHLPDPLGWATRVALVCGGVALNALATALYVGAGLGPGPRDGLMTGLVRRTGASVRLVRTAIEVTVVTAGWLLGGVVGPGTLLYALAVGPLVHLWLPRLSVPGPVTRAGSTVPEVSSGTRPWPPAGGAAAAGAAAAPGTPRTSGSRAAPARRRTSP